MHFGLHGFLHKKYLHYSISLIFKKEKNAIDIVAGKITSKKDIDNIINAGKNKEDRLSIAKELYSALTAGTISQSLKK